MDNGIINKIDKYKDNFIDIDDGLNEFVDTDGRGIDNTDVMITDYNDNEDDKH